jgi:ketosteroid isomerase-like protein
MTAFDFTRQAQEWIAAWNAHDLEQILAHYAEDVELISPFVAKLTGRSEGVVRGKAALRELFRARAGGISNTVFRLLTTLSGSAELRGGIPQHQRLDVGGIDGV